MNSSSHPAPERRWTIRKRSGMLNTVPYTRIDGPDVDDEVVIPEQEAEQREAELIEALKRAERRVTELLSEQARAALEEKGKLDG